MQTPKKFIVVYKSSDCKQEFEVENRLDDRLYIYCDDCDKTHYFYPINLIHKSWEWELIEEELDQLDIAELPGFSYELQS